MTPSRPFILRPVATSLLMVAVVIGGAVAYRQLPISALPEVDYPTIQVMTFYPGASPDVMATSVTAPLERQFGQMPGLKQMTSTSSFGSSVITLQFDLDARTSMSPNRKCRRQSTRAARSCPRDLPNPPVYSKVESGRRAGADPGAHLGDAAADAGAATGGYAARAEDLAARRRRPGHASAAGRSRRCASRPIPRRWPRYGLEPRGRAQAIAAGQRQSGERELRRAAAGVHHRCQRSAPLEQPITAR